jgi:hypothetical protein
MTANIYQSASDYTFLKSTNGGGIEAHYPSGANTWLYVEEGSYGQVTLAATGPTNANLTFTAAGTGVVIVTSPLSLTSLPTSCSGHPTNSVAAVSGVLTLCP